MLSRQDFSIGTPKNFFFKKKIRRIPPFSPLKHIFYFYFLNLFEGGFFFLSQGATHPPLLRLVLFLSYHNQECCFLNFLNFFFIE